MAAACRIFLASRRTFTRFLRTDSRLAAATVDSGILKQTVLHDFHEAQGGKMVPFAGWSMPVQYGDLSIINSCLHTRQNASIFDVSHMLQMEVTGADAENFLEYILVADLANLKNGSASLSMFTTAVGGIIDDCIVTRTGENTFYIVSNAGRADADLHHMKSQLMQFKNGSANVTITPFDDKGLVALQGPKSASVLQQGVVGDLSQLKFMHSAVMDVFDIPQCRVSRCGYTGEDGFEISVPADKAVQLVETLLAREEGIVKLAGLGARDVLRLEAGLCLYGNDISEETTPIEAGLAWCISKRRRNEGGFLGADLILQQLKDKPARKRVGFVTESGPPVRQGCQVSGKTGDVIGTVTSGSPSPTLNINIAMAYVPRGLSKVNTELTVHIRKHMVNARVVKMPFVPSNYYN